MKNFFCLLLVTVFVINVFGQIQGFVFQGVKDYEDQTRIAYFNLEGFKDADEIYFVRKALLQDDAIYRFEIYKSENAINNCMIETTPDYDELKIQELINKEIRKSDNLKKEHQDDIWEYYRIVYEIPEDCPVFHYYPITKENKEEFLIKIKEWKELNQEKYQEIKHLKEKLNIPE